jgi:beta-phosphoglucomutase-like phosphatase (HAD superfamily)
VHYFEDLTNGVLATKCAGMECVTVPTFVIKNLDFHEVDYNLESMAPMELKELISFLTKH